MHGTRTTVKILVGVAVAALSGCVSVEARPVAPAPPGDVGRPTQDAAPQIVEGPAREALEAALPAPPPARPAPGPAQEGREHPRNAGGPAAHPGRGRASAAPEQHRHRDRPAVEHPLPKPPRHGGDVCDLGERYGGWRPDSDQAKICRGTYRR
ncbi:hypothetical protein ACIGBL_19340 [Streptomyces sp. NPDC085614]|uniref:hypothetical protein n=1 Tax=Streptomyces sp. NPDC085614 TaxID=3365733 RepID=UPI0037D1CAFA